MAYHIRMSTNPAERIQHWKSREGHTGSQILANGLTCAQAQARETDEAQRRDCRASGGGQYVPGNVWSVYHV